MFRYIVVLCTLLASAAQAKEHNPLEEALQQLEKAVKRLEELRDKQRHLDKTMPTEHPRFLELPNIEAWYVVEPNGSLKLHRGKSRARHFAQWELMRKIADRPLEDVYTTFVAFNSKELEGKATIGGTVYTRISPMRAGLAINQVVYDLVPNADESAVLKVLIPTLIHEYAGHVKYNSQPHGLDIHGCLKRLDSVLPIVRQFAEQFWTWCDDALPHKRSKRDYVSDYAMLSVEEDIAESITAFIFCSRPAQTKRTIEKKLDFFWDQLELVDYRKHVRSGFKNRMPIHSYRC